jgi:hypothetical protein
LWRCCGPVGASYKAMAAPGVAKSYRQPAPLMVISDPDGPMLGGAGWGAVFSRDARRYVFHAAL